MRREDVSFRPLEIESDVHLLYQWLAEQDVNRWYDEGVHTLENYRQKFGTVDTTRRYITKIQGKPAGYIQCYWLHDEPKYARQIGLDHDAVGIDMFLGERRGEGWGSLVLRQFLALIVFGGMRAEHACINPDPANIRAVRSYEKAGFRGDRVVHIVDDEPGNAGPERIMLMSRAEFGLR